MVNRATWGLVGKDELMDYFDSQNIHGLRS